MKQLITLIITLLLLTSVATALEPTQDIFGFFNTDATSGSVPVDRTGLCPNNFCSSDGKVCAYALSGTNCYYGCTPCQSGATCSSGVCSATGAGTIPSGNTSTDTLTCYTCDVANAPVGSGYPAGAVYYTKFGRSANANILDVIFNRQSSTTENTCESLGASYGKFLSTTPVQCLGGQVQEDLAMFQPKISRVFIEDLNGNPVEITGLTAVPDTIASQFHPGDPVNVIFELDNSAPKYTLSPVDNQVISSTSTYLLNLYNKAYQVLRPTTLFIVTGGNSLLYDWITTPAPSSDYSAEDKNIVQASNYLSFGTTEVAIYSENAAKVAYGYDFNRAIGFTDIATVKMRDSCQTGETTSGFNGDTGFITTYTVVFQPTIDGNCFEYTDTNKPSIASIQNPLNNAKGGACKIRIRTTVKVPKTGSQISGTGSPVSNYDSAGNYVLHVGVFDRCWTSSTPVRYQVIKGFSMKISSANVSSICCDKQLLNWQKGLLWSDITRYETMTPASCSALGGTQTTDLTKCAGVKICYVCNDNTIQEVTSATGKCDPVILHQFDSPTALNKVAPNCQIVPSHNCWDKFGAVLHVNVLESCASKGYYDPQLPADLARCVADKYCTTLSCYTCEGTSAKLLNNTVLPVSAGGSCKSYSSDTVKLYDSLTIASQMCSSSNAGSYYEKGEQFCTTGDNTCYDKKPVIEMSELSQIDPIAYADSDVWADSGTPVCVDGVGKDFQCQKDGQCLLAKKSVASVNADANQIYESFKSQKLVGGLAYFGENIGPVLKSWIYGPGAYTDPIEAYGVCVYEKRDAWSVAKRYVSKIIGIDWTSNTANYVMIGLILVIVGVIYVFLKSPPPKMPARPRKQKPAVQQSGGVFQ